VNRDLAARRIVLDEEKTKVARLSAISRICAASIRLEARRRRRQRHQGRLVSAQEKLSDEMKRVLGQDHRKKDDAIGGVPVDSEYVIFCIDTSGSIHYSWH